MHAFGFPVTQRQQSDFNIVFFCWGGGEIWQTCTCQVNSSHFRGFFTGSDPVKNALFTGFEIFYAVKNAVKVHRFLTGFSQVFSLCKISQGFSQGFT